MLEIQCFTLILAYENDKITLTIYLTQSVCKRSNKVKRLYALSFLLFFLIMILSACNTVQADTNTVDTKNNPLDRLNTGDDGSGVTGSEQPLSEFIIHFFDVGQGDSALIVCDGKTMLIDGGEASASRLLYSFLENHRITHLDYIVATHAHSDHVGGLAGALNYATAGIALSPVTEYDSRPFNSFVRYLDEQDVSITVPCPGYTFMLGSAEVFIAGPISPSTNPNNTSIVIKITYGETSFLFTGDAERPEEQDILEAGYDISSTVLKVGHHGSDTSTTYPFLREILPQFAVISCGEGNSYGHPDENTLSRLRDADVTVFRTDMQGTITCTSDGVTVSFTTERNQNAITNPTVPSPESALPEYYIGNKKTKRFHLPTCSGLPQEQNRVQFNTREEAVVAGYSHCGTCNP